jgi:hypothetical protein
LLPRRRADRAHQINRPSTLATFAPVSRIQNNGRLLRGASCSSRPRHSCGIGLARHPETGRRS